MFSVNKPTRLSDKHVHWTNPVQLPSGHRCLEVPRDRLRLESPAEVEKCCLSINVVIDLFRKWMGFMLTKIHGDSKYRSHLLSWLSWFPFNSSASSFSLLIHTHTGVNWKNVSRIVAYILSCTTSLWSLRVAYCLKIWETLTIFPTGPWRPGAPVFPWRPCGLSSPSVTHLFIYPTDQDTCKVFIRKGWTYFWSCHSCVSIESIQTNKSLEERCNLTSILSFSLH